MHRINRLENRLSSKLSIILYDSSSKPKTQVFRAHYILELITLITFDPRKQTDYVIYKVEI